MSHEPLFDLAGKRALITGASSGLGAYFAEVLGGAGASVVLAARRADALEKVADRLRQAGGTCSTLILDIAQTNASEALDALQGDVDILVNNAGLVREGPAIERSIDDWNIVQDTNLRGAFFMAQWFARRRIAAGKDGVIINIASILGLRQAGGVLPYAVSKAGLIQMTKSLALEWARHGIRVNALAPGYFRTELNKDFWETRAGREMIGRIPQRRLGAVEDLAGPLLLLASDASRYMMGAVISVDGGHLVSTL